MASTKHVLNHHLKTFDQADLKGATDTFAVREGKIVAQSFTAKITPKS